jgi:CDP-6-deoxy-D-xylo-4-hexulose-3-dehydrase
MNLPLMKNNIIREDLDLVIDYLKQDDPILTNGKKVIEFERLWSEWLGVKYSVFVNSGASSNYISMGLLKQLYPEGGEVIVPPLTWISDIASVIAFGFKPVFVDIDLKNLSLSDNKISEKITDKTLAIFLTHAQGFNGLSEKIIKLCNDKNILLIEDVCESHGSSFKNKKNGSYGWVSNFSFYYAHHMSTIEGGMICTNDEETYQRARIYRSHGMLRESNSEIFKQNIINNDKNHLNPEFIFMYPAFNMRNTEIGAIIGLNQLKRLDDNIKSRNNNHQQFLENISNNFFKEFDLNGSSNYAFNLIIKEKNDNYLNKLCLTLKENNIEFRRGSAGGGNQLRQPYIQKYLQIKDYSEFNNVEHVHFYGMYLGNYPDLTKDEIKWMCKIINSV